MMIGLLKMVVACGIMLSLETYPPGAWQLPFFAGFFLALALDALDSMRRKR